MVGYLALKKPKLISYSPGATVKIIDLSSSQRKFSGHVLIVWISQGMANPFYSSPLFHNHLAEQFSAQSASLIEFYSVKASWSSVFVTTFLSKSSCISSNALFTSSVLDFMSKRAHTSFMFDLRDICFTISWILFYMCSSNVMNYSLLNFVSICLKISSFCILRTIISSFFANYALSFLSIFSSTIAL